MTSFNQPLLNDSIFFLNSSGTTEVVSAADNVAGILVTAINLSMTSSSGVLYTGAVNSQVPFLILKDSGSYTPPFIVPAGERLSASCNNDITIFYKVL